MSRIAIISALHEELAEVLALMQSATQQTWAGREYWRGQLHGHEVVAVQTGIGKVAAAATAAVLLQRFEADHVIFTGVAGGLSPSVQVGDMVVGQRYLQHDLDVSPLFPPYVVPGYGRAEFEADRVLAQVLMEAARDTVTWLPKLFDTVSIPALGLHRPTAHQGLLICGDRFVSTQAESDALRAAHPEALAVDMESAAVAQVCLDHGVPFAAVRTISDRADDEAHVDFQHFLQQVARHCSARVVRKALNLL
jgi:adenosylhomocysteine nucleosidase